MLERVQGQATVAPPSAAHHSVAGKYAFSEDGIPTIITPRSAGVTPRSTGVTPRSAGMTPRSIGQTPRAPPRTDSQAVGSSSLENATCNNSKPGDPTVKSGSTGLGSARAKVSKVATSPSIGSIPREGAQARSAKRGAANAPASAPTLGGWEELRGPEYRKTHIDYSKRIQLNPPLQLDDLKNTSMSLPSNTASDRGGATTTKGVRGGILNKARRGIHRP